MKVGNLLSSRPNWYDRNPLEIAKQSIVLAAVPHAGTTRATYTVPANRKFLLEAGLAGLERQTVAAPAALLRSEVTYANSGATQVALMPSIQTQTNTAFIPYFMSLGLQAICLAGATVTIQDADASTGGTVNYWAAYKGSEYDA